MIKFENIFSKRSCALIKLFDRELIVYGLKKDSAFQDLASKGYYYIFEGRYKNSEEIIKKLTNKNDIILDLGSNYGLMGLTMALHCPKGMVYSFEASKNLALCHQKTIKRNLISNNVVFCEILSNEVKTVKFFETPAVESSNFIISEKDMKYPPTNQKFKTELRISISVEELIKKYNIPKVDFVKIDCEGSELEILQGIKGKKNFSKTKFLIEFNSYAQIFYKKIHPEVYLNELFKCFKKIYSINEEGNFIPLENTEKQKINFLHKNFLNGFVNDLVCTEIA